MIVTTVVGARGFDLLSHFINLFLLLRGSVLPQLLRCLPSPVRAACQPLVLFEMGPGWREAVQGNPARQPGREVRYRFRETGFGTQQARLDHHDRVRSAAQGDVDRFAPVEVLLLAAKPRDVAGLKPNCYQRGRFVSALNRWRGRPEDCVTPYVSAACSICMRLADRGCLLRRRSRDPLFQLCAELYVHLMRSVP